MLASTRVLMVIALALAGSTAGAHTGHATHSLAAGLVHPLAVDHLLAMLAVGLWAATAPRLGQRLLVPLVFMAALLFGAVAGHAGMLPLPGEAAIAASLVLFGALLVAPRLLPRPAALLAIAGAALLHGLAHGAELPAGGSFTTYAAGFVLATTLLHGLGLLLGQRLLGWHAGALRLVGWCTGAAALLLLAVA